MALVLLVRNITFVFSESVPVSDKKNMQNVSSWDLECTGMMHDGFTHASISRTLAYYYDIAVLY